MLAATNEVAPGRDALHVAHESRDKDGAPLELIHRDVNPSNVFTTWKGAVRVIDFGLAKARGRVSRTNDGVVKGKLGYMAPEQAALHPPRLDRRVDVYALGIMPWELSLGRRLLERDMEIATVLGCPAKRDSRSPLARP